MKIKADVDEMEQLDVKALDQIIRQTMEAVEKGKSQIFDIYEAARNEMENVRKDVERVKQEAAEIIFKVDELTKRERRARLRLVDVHRNFRLYTEEQTRQAYQETENLRVEIEVTREREANLRRRRDELDLRLRSLKTTADKAEVLASQVGVALNFLSNQMGHVLSHLENLQQRQAYGARIIKAQEEERRRVARDIHDGPAQAMANVVFRAEVCERLIETDIDRAKEELKELREQVRMVLRETRKLIFGLRPMTLDDLGLAPTIKRLLDNMKERGGINAEIRVSGQEVRLDPPTEVGLFRVIQEALTNVEKHSKAKLVRVRLDFRSNAVSASVEDDGIGFESMEIISNESFGMTGMKERLSLLGGEVTVKSQKGKGTKVYINVPLVQP